MVIVTQRRPMRAKLSGMPGNATFLFAAGILLGIAIGDLTAVAGDAIGDGGDVRRRPYVTGIVGSSLGGDESPKQGGWIGNIGSPTVGGDAAVGMAIDRTGSAVKGAVRVELEGRTRPRGGTIDAGQGSVSGVDWSTMANVWRDVPITRHFGGYAGGGVGASGGGGVGGDRQSEVTWQVGGGVTYAFNDRLTLDVGYRVLPDAFAGKPAGGQADGPSGELLLSVRLYEPFRGWLRD